MQPDFSIGQLARLFDVPVATLRYYDQIGLLTPARVDQQSHYRYYATEQFERLSTIKYFRALGVPLATIGDFFAARELPKLETMLITQQHQVHEQLLTLQAIDQRLQSRLAQVQQAQTATLGVSQLVQLPARPMVFLRQNYRPSEDIELVIAKLRTRYGITNSVFLGKIGLTLSLEELNAHRFTAYDGVCLLFEPGDVLPADQQLLTGGDYLQLTFQGTHADAAPYYQQLLADCQQRRLTVRAAAVETALIDYGITDSINQSVTQIQLPVTTLS